MFFRCGVICGNYLNKCRIKLELTLFFRVGFQAYVSFIWKDDDISFNSRCFVSCKLLLWKLDNIRGWVSDLYFCCSAIV